MGKMLGIDLGTAYTRFCLEKEGVVLRAPSVVSIENKTKQVLAAGTEAKLMIGRTPSGISAIKPIRNSIVSNKTHAALMLGTFLEKKELVSAFRRPTILSAIPSGASATERETIEEALFEAGASAVLLTESPIAAAIGAGMKIANARGSMIVDIGAGSIEVAVISQGRVVISSSLQLAGEAMTDAVIQSVINNHSILIGEMTAEQIKVKLGTLSPADLGTAEISGKSTKMGGAARATVSSGELREALLPYAENIVKTIRAALEALQPELSADIFSYGILICGGGSLLPGLTEYIKDALGMNVTRAKAPLDCVCLGISRILAGGSEMRRFICSSAK